MFAGASGGGGCEGAVAVLDCIGTLLGFAASSERRRVGRVCRLITDERLVRAVRRRLPELREQPPQVRLLHLALLVSSKLIKRPRSAGPAARALAPLRTAAPPPGTNRLRPDTVDLHADDTYPGRLVDVCSTLGAPEAGSAWGACAAGRTS